MSGHSPVRLLCGCPLDSGCDGYHALWDDSGARSIEAPAAEDDTRSQALDAEGPAGVDNPRHCPGLPGAGSARGAQPPPPQVRYVYGGIDRRGCARTGVTFDNPAVFAERQFRAGWRRLEVRTDDEERREVGSIGPCPDTGRRTWWAES